MKTRELEQAVIYECPCGQTSRGPVMVYKGAEARKEFLRQFVFGPADRLAEASDIVRRAVSEYERLLATAVAKRNGALDQFEKLRQDVYQALTPTPQAEAEVMHDTIANHHLFMEPNWDQLRVIVTPAIACLCDRLVPKLNAGWTFKVYTCKCPECEAVNDWKQPPANPVTCGSCGQEFQLDFTLLWPGGINATSETRREELVEGATAGPQGCG